MNRLPYSAIFFLLLGLGHPTQAALEPSSPHVHAGTLLPSVLREAIEKDPDASLPWDQRFIDENYKDFYLIFFSDHYVSTMDTIAAHAPCIEERLFVRFMKTIPFDLSVMTARVVRLQLSEVYQAIATQPSLKSCLKTGIMKSRIKGIMGTQKERSKERIIHLWQLFFIIMLKRKKERQHIDFLKRLQLLFDRQKKKDFFLKLGINQAKQNQYACAPQAFLTKPYLIEIDNVAKTLKDAESKSLLDAMRMPSFYTIFKDSFVFPLGTIDALSCDLIQLATGYQGKRKINLKQFKRELQTIIEKRKKVVEQLLIELYQYSSISLARNKKIRRQMTYPFLELIVFKIAPKRLHKVRSCAYPKCCRQQKFLSTRGRECLCRGCKEAYYCSRHCQKRHWKSHHRYVCTRKERETDLWSWGLSKLAAYMFGS